MTGDGKDGRNRFSVFGRDVDLGFRSIGMGTALAGFRWLDGCMVKDGIGLE